MFPYTKTLSIEEDLHFHFLNRFSYIKDCIESILNQSYEDFEALFIDDGSLDASFAIINEYVHCDNRIKLYHQNNAGVSTARNLGLKFVKTPWVTFTDPDDFLNDIYFEKIDNFLKNSKERDNISIISTNMIFFYEKNNVYKDNHPLAFKFKNEQLVLPVSKMGKNVIQKACFVVENK